MIYSLQRSFAQSCFGDLDKVIGSDMDPKFLIDDLIAKNIEIPKIFTDLKVDKRIKWMAWWDIDETTAAAELFKKAYGIPSTELVDASFPRGQNL